MIRPAVSSDIQKLTDMAQVFVKDLPFEATIDVPHLSAAMEHLISGDMGCVFVNDEVTAAIGGMVYPHFFNPNMTMAQEMFWWVNPDARKSRTGLLLLAALEDWAVEKGATIFTMMCLDGVYTGPLEALYQKRGFTPLEHHFAKVL